MSKQKPISGYPEFLPAVQIKQNQVMDVIRRAYESVGAVPIDTPAVERIENLTKKGGNEKEIYGLRRLQAGDDEDDGRDATSKLGLRFDLTVPLARYTVQHANDLAFPFRRYQMQPVWRGERPQGGRYRQFYQCDIDVIGDGSLSLLNDAEMPVVIDRIFSELDIGAFVISINNRKILTGYLQSLGLNTDVAISAAVKVIDNLGKVGTQRTRFQLTELGVKDEDVGALLDFFTLDMATDAALALLRSRIANDTMGQGVEELETVVGYMRMLGMQETHFRIDPSIARGLDYYTGTVYETQLIAHPGLGSICSGGRYDKLLRTLGADRDLLGVGISIGLTRLLPRLIDAGVMKIGPATIAPVLVTVSNPQKLAEYLAFATTLRNAGVNTELYTEPKQLGNQMKFANKKGFSVVVIAAETEFTNGTVTLRRLYDGEQIVVQQHELVQKVCELLTTA